MSWYHVERGPHGFDMADNPAYAAAWRSYRRSRRAFWALFVLFLPALALVNRAVGAHANGGTIVAVTAFAWMIACSLAGYRSSNFACPRCGKLFFRKFDDRPWRGEWAHNPFARRCMHCGLAKWSTEDA
jgi:hypothetical protein